jgi:hypothetical protein
LRDLCWKYLEWITQSYDLAYNDSGLCNYSECRLFLW